MAPAITAATGSLFMDVRPRALPTRADPRDYPRRLADIFLVPFGLVIGRGHLGSIDALGAHAAHVPGRHLIVKRIRGHRKMRFPTSLAFAVSVWLVACTPAMASDPATAQS